MKKKVICSIMSVILTLIPIMNLNAMKLTKSQKQFNAISNGRANLYIPKKNLNFQNNLNFINTPKIKSSKTPLKTASNIYKKKQLHQNFQTLLNFPKMVNPLRKFKTTPNFYISQNYLKNSNNKDFNIKRNNIQKIRNIEKNNIHFEKHPNKFLQDEFNGIQKRKRTSNTPLKVILVNKLKPKCLVSNFNENPKNINNKNAYSNIYKEKMDNLQKNRYYSNKPITNLKTKNFDDSNLHEDEINYEENDSIINSNTIIDLLELLDEHKKKNIPKQKHPIKKHNTDFNRKPTNIEKLFQDLNIKKNNNKNDINIYKKNMIQKKQNMKNMKNLVYSKKIRNTKPTKYYKKKFPKIKS